MIHLAIQRAKRSTCPFLRCRSALLMVPCHASSVLCQFFRQTSWHGVIRRSCWLPHPASSYLQSSSLQQNQADYGRSSLMATSACRWGFLPTNENGRMLAGLFL